LKRREGNREERESDFHPNSLIKTQIRKKLRRLKEKGKDTEKKGKEDDDEGGERDSED